MKHHLLITLFAALAAGCVFPSARITSRNELEGIVSRNPSNNENWYYCGTDAENHHFITRTGGNTGSFLVPKEQIALARRVPLPPPGVTTLYQVYPARDFVFGKETMQWHYGR
jgi:hypothetical protein